MGEGLFESLILVVFSGLGENDIHRDRGRLVCRDNAQCSGKGLAQAPDTAGLGERFFVDGQQNRVGRARGRLAETKAEVIPPAVDLRAGRAPAQQQAQADTGRANSGVPPKGFGSDTFKYIALKKAFPPPLLQVSGGEKCELMRGAKEIARLLPYPHKHLAGEPP